MNDIEPTDDAVIVPEDWPRSLSDMGWGMQRIGKVRAAIADIRRQEKEADAALHARADDIVGKMERSIAYVEAKMMQRADEWKPDLLVGKKKSRDLLEGRIGWRKRGGKLTVTQKDDLVAWLTSQDDTTLYRLTVSPDMKRLQELCRETGVIPPGCEWEGERDEVYLEPNPLPTLEVHPTPKVLP